MELVELTEFLVKNLVKDIDSVEVNVAETNNFNVIQVLVS